MSSGTSDSQPLNGIINTHKRTLPIYPSTPARRTVAFQRPSAGTHISRETSRVSDYGRGVRQRNEAGDRVPPDTDALAGLQDSVDVDSIERPDVISDDDLQDSVKTLLNGALQLDQRSAKERFLPSGDLNTICNHAAVVKELLDNKYGTHEAEACAEYVCQRPAVEIFAVLVLINQLKFLRDFKNAGISDKNLPFRVNKDRTELLCRQSDGKDCLEFLNHSRDAEMMREFYSKQWWVHVPFLDWDKENRKALNFRYEPGTVLPWTYIGDEDKSGGFGIVEKVKIHPDHHSFTQYKFFALKSMRGEYVKENYHFFQKEIAAFRKMSSGPHLVELCATLEITGEKFMLLFPWAEGGSLEDLMNKSKKDLLKSYDLTEKEFIRWVAMQCRGLIEALGAIHYTRIKHTHIDLDGDRCSKEKDYGIHGDIKPANILHFSQETTHCRLGNLKVADFGLVTFHAHASRTMVNSQSAHAASQTYRSPEHDISYFMSKKVDVWALGCVFSELMTWVILDNASCKDYQQERKNEPSFSGAIKNKGVWKEDNFFLKHQQKKRLAERLYALVKNGVSRIMKKNGSSPTCPEDPEEVPKLKSEIFSLTLTLAVLPLIFQVNMAEVAGLVLGAVGVAGLIGAFKDTIDLFGLLADARDLGRDYEILKIKFDIQKTLLLQWSDRVGLLRTNDYDPLLDQAHIREAIGETLSCIRLLLTDGTALRSKYGIDVVDDQVGASHLTSVSSISAWRMGVFKNQYDDFKKRMAQGNEMPFRSRALWAVRDKTKFQVLVADLADLITTLDRLIPVTRKQPALQTLVDDDVRRISGLSNLKMLLEASQDTHRLISQSTEKTISRTCEEMVLSRLWFRKIHDRRETVTGAHRKTLRWALYPPRDKALWDDLSRWLRKPSQDGIYWISGKAGSGKSTLMKYNYTEERTKMLLKEWSRPASYILADFFFFDLGTEEQKTFEGLSRALLYQLLKPDKSLVHQALPGMVRELRETDKTPSLPSISEIRHAFSVITRQTNMPKCCIFIDGLDEFKGDVRESISLIQELGKSDRIKVLVSSRPIPACVSAYQHLPKLHLQNLTRGDIEAFVEDTIGCHQYMKRLLKRSPSGARILLKQLVDKSSGVFLWVVLACRSLLSGFDDCDRLPELQKRVDELPPELEDLFDVMLGKINHRYQYQGARLLRLCYESQLASRTPKCPALSYTDTLCLALVDDADISADVIGDLSSEDKNDLCIVLEGRLRSRCGGLLEIRRHAPGADNQLVGSTVVFMHRTVFEYLSNDFAWERECLKTDPHGDTVATDLAIRDLYLMILSASGLKSQVHIGPQWFLSAMSSAFRSGLFWVQNGDASSQISFFEQLPHFLTMVKACHTLPGTTTRNYLHAPLLLAVDLGLRDYITRNPEFYVLNGSAMPEPTFFSGRVDAFEIWSQLSTWRECIHDLDTLVARSIRAHTQRPD
ncbi:hypothetical protein FGRA07_09559 [Fusarium graminearum]|nr:hypothetical protein FGRA07_09559 [Fusarium graminearum]